MASFLVTLVTWASLFCALWYGAHQRYYPPGDWIGAALVSFFVALGIGGLRKARLEKRDARLLAAKDGILHDGERVAIAGTLEPESTPLHAPLSGAECLVYDWSISHMRTVRDSSSERTERIDRSGLALAPSVIRSEGRSIRLLACPGIEGFPETPKERMTAERARSYIRSTNFEEPSIVRELAEVREITADETGAIRKDWKLSKDDDLEDAIFRERYLPPGAAVCVVGRYSAEKSAIVPQANTGGVRAIRGTREEALSFVGASRLGDLIGGFLLILVPAAIVWGVLTYREHWFDANQRPSVRSERQEALQEAVAKGNVAALAGFIRRGVDLDAPDSNGDTPLMKAPDAATAAALLDGGAHVNKPGRDGLTPLMFAAARGNADVVRLLLARHADLALRDSTNEHKTALDYATVNGQDDVAQLLRAAAPLRR